MTDISIIIPVYNEEDSIAKVIKGVLVDVKKEEGSTEIIVVDDGSTDKTKTIVEKLMRKHDELKLISHRINLGKSEALTTGFNACLGDIVLFMDGDLQYSASDISRFIQKINDGFDVVNGWRIERNDTLIRKIPSRAYNYITNVILGPKLHDHNCGMKAFRKDVVEDILLRTGHHRYITSIAYRLGYTVSELKVKHHPRKYGVTKYSSMTRFFSGVIDMLALRFQLNYSNHPLMVFGSLGGIFLILGMLLGLWLVSLYIARIPGGTPLKTHLPALLLSVTLVIAGLVVFVFGLLADMISALKKDVEAVKLKLGK